MHQLFESWVIELSRLRLPLGTVPVGVTLALHFSECQTVLQHLVLLVHLFLSDLQLLLQLVFFCCHLRHLLLQLLYLLERFDRCLVDGLARELSLQLCPVFSLFPRFFILDYSLLE